MKKAIIIGATSGIGKGLALLLIKNNYKVGITGRRVSLLGELKAECPELFFSKPLDVTDTINATLKLKELVVELGGLDLFIVCSGTGDINNNLDFGIEKTTILTNVIGFTSMVDWGFNYFQNKKSGHLVAISSIGGLRGSRQAPAYNASKAYQINYLEGLQQKATNLKMPIYITDIRPGFVDTDMAKGEGKFWVAPVDKATMQMMNAIINKKKLVYITKRWSIIAKILKYIPNALYNRM
jgi:short-subunit dehydrogenase